MSTLDELERSVERLNRAVERLSSGMGKYGFANVYNDDVKLLLSERTELLATVERMRGALEEFSKEYDGFMDGDGHPCPTLARARAALATGEAGLSICQNDKPGLAFSGEGVNP